MAPPNPITQHVFIDGSFSDLALELAEYLSITSEVNKPLQENKKDDALKKLIVASASLNSKPEKEFTAAYNLLIYLVLQSPSVNMFLPRICDHLSKPITSSPNNGSGLALNVLTTVFNLLPRENTVRFNVFEAIVGLVRNTGSWEALRPQLGKLEWWMREWDVDEEDQRKLFRKIVDVADEAGEEEQAYTYLLRTLTTFDATETSELTSPESQTLSLRALKLALLSPTHFDFHDLTSLPAIQSLSDTAPLYSELLSIFSEKELEDYNDFLESHSTFLANASLDASILSRKMRLLTLASLAASTSSRQLEYSRIAKALQIKEEDVEMWVIDVIRAGLVEGKLSQRERMFLIHRTTYRVFGEKQWREVATRLEQWRESLRGVREVISRERIASEGKRDGDVGMGGMGQGGKGMGGGGGRRREMVDLGAD